MKNIYTITVRKFSLLNIKKSINLKILERAKFENNNRFYIGT